MSHPKAKYDTIGKTYNKTRHADPYLTERLIANLDPKPDGVYLDIGCGSGNYTNELYQKNVQISGIDPSIKMLEKARRKNPAIDYKLGVAENIPLENATIDGATAFLTIHHWTDLQKGFKEIARILKSKGRFVIFHSTPQQMHMYWLNDYFPEMMKNSCTLMPTLEKITQTLDSAGLKLIYTENYTMKSDLQDLFLQCGKYNPELYFKPEIRAGISSFAAVANREEVSEGLKKLRIDIETGKINDIITSYQSDLGDYLYIIAEKN